MAGFRIKNSDFWFKSAGRQEAGGLRPLFVESASRENREDIHAKITDISHIIIYLAKNLNFFYRLRICFTAYTDLNGCI